MNEHDIVQVGNYPAVVIGGIPRILNKHSPDPLKRAAFPPFESAAPTVDPALWVELDRRTDFGDQYILDQQSHGSCHPAGTRVRMADGTQRPIEEIRPLESVLTAEGRTGRVLSVMARDETEALAKIHLCGHKHLRCTPEHPILTKRGYVAAAKLEIGDWIAMPRYMATATKIVQTAEHIRPTRWTVRGRRERMLNGGPAKQATVPITVTEPPDILHLTTGAGRIFGLFLSEGNTDKTRIVWTFNINEDDTLAAELVGLLKSEWGVEAHRQYRSERSTVKVVVYGVLWAQLFESLCSTGSGRKKLHRDIASAPLEFQEGMLSGWLAGDGYARRKTTQGVTVSHDLALSMFDIAQAIGKRPTIRLSHPAATGNVKTRQPRWDVEWGSDNRGEMDETHVWRKCQGVILESFNGPVYNLHIEGDNSYVAEGIGVHNCVGFSSAGALMRALVLAGHAMVRLSGAYTYSWINGGQDNGAQISDSLTSLMSHGTCTEAEVDWNHIYRNQIPASADTTAQRFRIEEAYKVANFAELMSGLQLGFIGVVAVQVGNTFTRLDSEGVCGFDRGSGNHAVCVDGAKKTSRGWTPDMPNTWGLSFGQRGRGRLTQQHIEGVEQDAYIMRAVRIDPQDPNKPPAVTG